MTHYKKNSNRIKLYNDCKNLHQLANFYETDKGTANKFSLSWGSNWPDHHTLSYTKIYEKYMVSFRETDTPVEFFEIGICDQRFPLASPQVWLSYFKNINLYCLDNFWGHQPNQENINILSALGIEFFYGDQSSNEDWEEIKKIIPHRLDFIVEDGSHDPYHMLFSLYKSIPLLKPGGFYFMEDLQHENTKGCYGYDNASVFQSILRFKFTNQFNSTIVNSEINKEIEKSFTVKDIHYGGPNDKTTILCVFEKK